MDTGKPNAKRSIVIPAYAEAKFIEGTLDQLYAYLKHLDWLDGTEIIVVTADAADGTPELVARHIGRFPLHIHVRPGSRAGKGRDVRAGLEASSAPVVMFMDADLATPLKHVEPILHLVGENGGMAIGVRDLEKMHKTAIRRLSSRISNLIIRSVIGWDIRDSQCGFKAFDRRMVDLILQFSRINGWGMDFEYIKIARVNDVAVSSLAVPDWTDPKGVNEGLAGDSQLSAMMSTLKELRKVWWNAMRGRYAKR